jgi:hypothetical protein
MRAFLDDRPLTLDRPTMAAAIRAGVDAAGALGRVVVEVSLDGEPVGDAVLQNPPETSPGAELRLTSIDPRALVADTLRDAGAALDAVREEQRHAADLIWAARLDEALAPLSTCVQTWNGVRDAVGKSVAMLGADFEARAGEAGLGAAAQSLAGHLGELRRCLEAQDWSGLSDCLAFDLTREAAAWCDLLGAMNGACAAPARA